VIRFFDIFFSLLGLVFGLPVLLLLTVLGFFDTGSPVFRQTRVGRHKKPFILLKFDAAGYGFRGDAFGGCLSRYATGFISAQNKAG
jgi:hypothetical protein